MKTGKSASIVAALVLAAGLIPRPAASVAQLASGRDFTLVKGTVSGSGGAGSGGAFTAWATVAQPDAGEVSGGTFVVQGSFSEGDPADCVALTSAVGVNATDASCFGVRITWGDATDHETGYRIVRNGVPLAVAAANVTSFDDSSAVAGVAYPYDVVTINDCGEADPSNTDSGRRLFEPTAPTDLAITGVQVTADSVIAHLHWRDQSASELRQIVYFLHPEPIEIASVGPDVESARVHVPNTGFGGYCFTVAAENCDIVSFGDSACTADIASTPEDRPAPSVFALGPIVPNPLHRQASIAFEVPRSSQIRIRIVDASGRLVRTIEDDVVAPGRYRAVWNGTDRKQHPAPSGIYFVEMVGPKFKRTTRLVLLR